MPQKNLDVVLLCGGKGTRMHPLTRTKPKPMVKIGDLPLVEHIIRHYHYYGFKSFKLLTGYLGYAIHNYFKKTRVNGAKIECLDTGEDSGQAERLWLVRDKLSSTFLWNYADDLGDVNLKEELAFHRRKKKLATMTVVPLQTRWGIVKINRQQIATALIEKPVISNKWINAGFFIMEKDVFKVWDFSQPESLAKGVLPKLTRLSQLACFKHQGFWSGVDTIREFEILNKLWKENKAAWAPWREDKKTKKGDLK